MRIIITLFIQLVLRRRLLNKNLVNDRKFRDQYRAPTRVATHNNFNISLMT